MVGPHGPKQATACGGKDLRSCTARHEVSAVVVPAVLPNLAVSPPDRGRGIAEALPATWGQHGKDLYSTPVIRSKMKESDKVSGAHPERNEAEADASFRAASARRA